MAHPANFFSTLSILLPALTFESAYAFKYTFCMNIWKKTMLDKYNIVYNMLLISLSLYIHTCNIYISKYDDSLPSYIYVF